MSSTADPASQMGPAQGCRLPKPEPAPNHLEHADQTHCDRNAELNFNGDDVVELTCETTTLDVFGQIGSTPGSDGWDEVTTNHTLRRNCEVTTGDDDGSDTFVPSAEWTVLDSNTFDGMGSHCP